MTSFLRALTFALVLPTLCLAGGCAAKDKHKFYSSVSKPTSLALIDAYEEQAVWSMDIPVNHMLSLDFKGNAPGDDGGIADSSSVTWKLYSVGDKPQFSGYGNKGTMLDSDTVDLSGKRVRIKVNYRNAPELPGSVDAAPIPRQDTAESVAQEAIAESKKAAEKAESVPADADENK